MNPQAPALSLNAIHVPQAPAWWPPAPGWWLLAAALLLPIAFACWRVARRRWRRRRWARLFDSTVDSADTPVAQVAAISQLLRRAARQVAPHAEALSGDDWLHFLDRGLAQPVFATGPGALLSDGGFRRALSAAEVDVLRAIGRARFLDWMAQR